MRGNARLRAGAVVGVLAVLAALLAGGGLARASTSGPPDQSSGAIAWTGESVVITDADTAGDVLYWYEPVGTTTWHQQTVATATSTLRYGAPEIAWTGSSVVIVAIGSDGSVYYWWQAAGTRPWNQQIVAGGSSILSYNTPAIATTNKSVVITAFDSNGALDYWYQPFGTSGWHVQQVAPFTGDDESNPSTSIAWTGGSVVIAAATGDGSIYYFWQAAGTGTWHTQLVAAGHVSMYYYYASIASTDTSVVIAAVAFGNLYYWVQPFGSTGWTQQTVDASGAYTSGTSIGWTGTSVIIATTTFNGGCGSLPHFFGMDYFYQPAGTATWTRQVVEPCGGAWGGGTSIAATNSSAVITSVDSAYNIPGNVDYWHQPYGTGEWPEQQVTTDNCC